MVASIAQMARGQENYYLDLAQEDYYLEGGEPPGKWFGNGAKQLGLEGKIKGDDLKAVLAGFSPESGRKLVQNAGSETRQVGWDMTFSAPKSVSIVWGIGDQDQRKQIEVAHEKAVQAALSYLEENALFSRIGKAGQSIQKSEAVVAAFLHGTSRDMDPNLHVHCLFANLGLGADEKSRTIVSKELYKHKMVAGALYRAALASELHQKLGFELVKVKNWFEIKGINKEARDHFSKRSLTINSVAGKDASAKEKNAACLKTRAVKGHVARDLLYERWSDEARQLGLDQAFVDKLFQDPKSASKEQQANMFAKQIDKAIDELSETESYFTVSQLFRSALEKIQSGTVRVDEALAELERSIKTNEKLVKLGEDTANKYLTSQEIKDAEQEMLQSAADLFETQGKKQVSFWKLRSVLVGSLAKNIAVQTQAYINERLPECLRFKCTSPDYQQLNEEQREALKHITVEKGSLKTISGRAGTGKTTMLSAAREAWESKGLKVVGCATSGKAAQELAQSGGINSETIRMTLLRLEKDRMRELNHHVRQVVRAFWKKPTYKHGQMKLDRKTVLVIDEASMVGTKDLSALLKHANKAGAKVVMIGDHRQLPSISAGSAFYKIFKATHGCELTQSVRQKTGWLREAADLYAEADVRGTLTKFAANNRLQFGRNGQEAQDTLISKWSKNRTKNESESIILAGKNKDVDELNQKAQDVRRRLGELGKSNLTFNKIQYHTGDRIAFHQNDRKLGVWNGDRGTIKHIINPINRFAARIVVELDRGETITFCPGRLKDKDDVSLGYASTVHKSQGMTVDKAFVLLDKDMPSQQSAYVALTRARLDTFISAESDHFEEDVVEFAKAQEDLERRLQRDRSKTTAFEQKQQVEHEAQRRRYQRVQEMHAQ